MLPRPPPPRTTGDPSRLSSFCVMCARRSERHPRAHLHYVPGGPVWQRLRHVQDEHVPDQKAQVWPAANPRRMLTRCCGCNPTPRSTGNALPYSIPLHKLERRALASAGDHGPAARACVRACVNHGTGRAHGCLATASTGTSPHVATRSVLTKRGRRAARRAAAAYSPCRIASYVAPHTPPGKPCGIEPGVPQTAGAHLLSGARGRRPAMRHRPGRGQPIHRSAGPAATEPAVEPPSR